MLSPDWLSAALSPRFPGVEVASTTVTETLQTMATKVRFDVEYANATVEAPPALCVKSYFGVGQRYRATAGLGETKFYRELASTLSVRVPLCLYTGIDSDTGNALIVMEDLVASGHTFLTALSPYTVEQAAATLDQLAQLHARYWGDESLASFSWLRPKLTSITSYITPEVLQEHLDGSRAEGLPDAVRRADRLNRAVLRVVERSANDVACLVHGDAHAGNLYETPDGLPGLVDWQVIQRSSWALDVSYHIGAVLDPELRAVAERDLLAHYLDRLAAYGVKPPSWDEAWFNYRTALVYGYYMWAVSRLVDPPVITEFVTRLGTAVAQHGTLDLLGT
ncbi:ecdysteroid 22-kinase family protein [Frankia gtarii]|uniref:ecdysteroid 22-kinase family protein n=1 Tax=Frankia gtarii TaxID=2950102 RepID=UPI0021C232D2|nr:ecdysteroid 22-kinase family protein [Frankia gtarii]